MISKERELLSRLSNAMESGGALERAREALRQILRPVRAGSGRQRQFRQPCDAEAKQSPN